MLGLALYKNRYVYLLFLVCLHVPPPLPVNFGNLKMTIQLNNCLVFRECYSSSCLYLCFYFSNFKNLLEREKKDLLVCNHTESPSNFISNILENLKSSCCKVCCVRMRIFTVYSTDEESPPRCSSSLVLQLFSMLLRISFSVFLGSFYEIILMLFEQLFSVMKVKLVTKYWLSFLSAILSVEAFLKIDITFFLLTQILSSFGAFSRSLLSSFILIFYKISKSFGFSATL